ncbi:MAG: nitrate reductase molybdenum cofactor assembly chaperone [Actinomycetes bacterium]
MTSDHPKDQQIAVARLAASWLLWYPDDLLLSRLDDIAEVAGDLPDRLAAPLRTFLEYLENTPVREVQAHYVAMFDMKRKACPYLTYWTDGDTRNRGRAILRFKQAYLESGFDAGDVELADHLAMVLEFAAVGDRLTGDALLAEHSVPIHLLRDALAKLGSDYVHVLDAIVVTLPAITPDIEARMAQLAASGPPAETVGLEPFGVSVTIESIGARR